jgi:hypothetical protein
MAGLNVDRQIYTYIQGERERERERETGQYIEREKEREIYIEKDRAANIDIQDNINFAPYHGINYTKGFRSHTSRHRLTGITWPAQAHKQ